MGVIKEVQLAKHLIHLVDPVLQDPFLEHLTAAWGPQEFEPILPYTWNTYVQGVIIFLPMLRAPHLGL